MKESAITVEHIRLFLLQSAQLLLDSIFSKLFMVCWFCAARSPGRRDILGNRSSVVFEKDDYPNEMGNSQVFKLDMDGQQGPKLVAFLASIESLVVFGPNLFPVSFISVGFRCEIQSPSVLCPFISFLWNSAGYLSSLKV